MTTPADWEAQQDRAVAMFDAMTRARAWCAANPDWNLAVNFNGLNGCIDVKVFHDNCCVKVWLDSEIMLFQMLNDATRFMGATRDWYTKYAGNDPDEAALAGNISRMPGFSRSDGVRWQNYTYCSRCGAQPGQQCKAIRTTQHQNAGEDNVAPHYGRLRFAANND